MGSGGAHSDKPHLVAVQQCRQVAACITPAIRIALPSAFALALLQKGTHFAHSSYTTLYNERMVLH